MTFSTDIDLLHWEPNILRDAAFASQTLISGTGDLSGTTFTLAAGSLATAHVTADQVIVLTGDISGCYPIVSVDSATQLTLSTLYDGLPLCESVAAIRRALDLGVNWIDTAPFYGWGRAEETVARAIEGHRYDVLLFTKCGTVPDESGSRMDLRPGSIRSDLEASLRRLRTDHVDLLQLHDVDPSTPIEDSWGEVVRLVSEGKVRYGGISNHPVEAIERALAVGPVGALQYQ